MVLVSRAFGSRLGPAVPCIEGRGTGNFILARGEFDEAEIAVRVCSDFASFAGRQISRHHLGTGHVQAVRIRDFTANAAAKGLRR